MAVALPDSSSLLQKASSTVLQDIEQAFRHIEVMGSAAKALVQDITGYPRSTISLVYMHAAERQKLEASVCVIGVDWQIILASQCIDLALIMMDPNLSHRRVWIQKDFLYAL